MEKSVLFLQGRVISGKLIRAVRRTLLHDLAWSELPTRKEVRAAILADNLESLSPNGREIILLLYGEKLRRKEAMLRMQMSERAFEMIEKCALNKLAQEVLKRYYPKVFNEVRQKQRDKMREETVRLYLAYIQSKKCSIKKTS